MIIARGLLGVFVLLLIAWSMSTHRRRIPWRVVGWGLGIQLTLAVLLLYTGVGFGALEAARDFVLQLVAVNTQGVSLVFGPLADPGSDLGFIFAFAGTGLPVIIFFGALMAVLYHLGIMQAVVWALGRGMSFLMGVSGAESMAMAANIFAGQTEAPLVVKPYLKEMTLSEMNALMTGGFATVAGSVLVVYMGMLGEEVGAHLLSASLMSAPAAFVVAKVMRPEVDEPVTSGKLAFRVDRTANNLIEAAANGTSDGLQLWLNVIAMLIAFTALVNLVNWPLGWIGEAVFGLAAGELTLAAVFGFVFAPIAWCMGVEGWHDCTVVGGLIGTKIAVNEFVAFAQMQSLVEATDGAAAFEHTRSAKIAAYVLCGFANFASIGIQIGGIAPLAPERKLDLTRLALRAMIGGALASALTATVAGMFL